MIPLSGNAEISYSEGGSGVPVIIVNGILDYKISLQGLQICCQQASETSPYLLTLAVNGMIGASFNGGIFNIPIMMSTTEIQYISYEFPEGCVETPLVVTSISQETGQTPTNVPIDITMTPGTLGAYTVDMYVNYWGKYISDMC